MTVVSYECNTHVFGGILESACLPVLVSVCPSVYKLLVSVKVLA